MNKLFDVFIRIFHYLEAGKKIFPIILCQNESIEGEQSLQNEVCLIYMSLCHFIQKPIKFQRRSRISVREGNILGHPPRGGSGWGSPREAGEFSKIFKRFFKKIAKNALFQHIFQKNLTKCINFSRFWTQNTNCWETLRNFRNFAKDFFREQPKCIPLAYFSKKLTISALIFRAFGRKTQIRGIFVKCMKIYDKNSIEN